MRTLQQWVDYIQTLHHRQIDLSLDRVRKVYLRLIPADTPFTVISIAGTNGKGSTAEMLSSIYTQAGYNVGKYTSPHLVYFNERYLINGQMVDDAELLAAFEKIEAVRGDVPITFFEFGTLIAIELFRQADIDIAVMEVGLGGRKDAVNVLDPDVAIITSISIDHTAWLGDNTDDISYEKVGIARPEVPCIVGINQPSTRITDYCDEIGANCLIVDQNFSYALSEQAEPASWQWQNGRADYQNLPLPFGQTGVQLSNASVAVCAIECLQNKHVVKEGDVQKGLAQASLAARCQLISKDPLIVLDVSHNVSSVQRLVNFVRNQLQPADTKISVICGMLNDKEVEASLSLISPIVKNWHLVTIDHERGSSSDQLAEIVHSIDASVQINTYANVKQAYQQVTNNLKNGDTLVVFGSFFIAGDILTILSD